MVDTPTSLIPSMKLTSGITSRTTWFTSLYTHSSSAKLSPCVSTVSGPGSILTLRIVPPSVIDFVKDRHHSGLPSVTRSYPLPVYSVRNLVGPVPDPCVAPPLFPPPPTRRTGASPPHGPFRRGPHRVGRPLYSPVSLKIRRLSPTSLVSQTSPVVHRGTSRSTDLETRDTCVPSSTPLSEYITYPTRNGQCQLTRKDTPP